jgi:transposase
VPGFATTLSVLVAVEIADIERFESPAHLHAYAGLIPSTHSSGGRTHHGHITKEGNPWLRWAVLEAVFPATQASLEIRGLYDRLARRKNPNIAKVAVARRLLAIIYRVLKEKRNYIKEMKTSSEA